MEPQVSTEDVQRMYNEHPYPATGSDGGLIFDLANTFAFLFPESDLAGWQILDAGCGTAHRLFGLASRYPAARFTGVDIAGNALRVGERLAKDYGLTNVDLQQADLRTLALGQRFDVVVATGVLHHLEDPRSGLRRLAAHLTDDALLLLWLYHSYGEFERLLDRELARLLAATSEQSPIAVLRKLGLKISPQRYGPTNAGLLQAAQDSLDVDAYLHPIVHTYRFSDVMELLRGDFSWVALNGINYEGGSKLLDFGGLDPDSFFCLTGGDLFPSAQLKRSFDRLPLLQRIRAVELVMRPTGFTILAGRGTSYRHCTPRLQGNLVTLEEAACIPENVLMTADRTSCR